MKKNHIFIFLVFSLMFTCFAENSGVSLTVKATRIEKSEDFFNKEIVTGDEVKKNSEMNEFFLKNGIEYINNGSVGTVTSVALDGGKSKHTLTTLDGVKLNSRASGSFDFSYIEPEIVSSTAILKNSASSIYGGAASGGVVNFSGLNYSDGVIGFRFGENGYKKVYLKNSIDKDTVFFFSNKEFGGLRTIDSGRQNSFYLKNSKGNNIFSVYFSEKDIKAPGPSTFLQIGNYQEGEIFLVNYEGKLSRNLTQKISFLKNELKFFEIAENKLQPTEYSTINYELNYKKDNMLFGINMEENDYESSQFVDTDADWVSDAWDFQEKDEDILSFYSEIVLSDEFYVSLRQDDHDDYDNKTVYNFGYKLSENITVNYGEGYFIPTFQDLYWPNEAGAVGNPNLVPEESENISVTIKESKTDIYIYKNEYENLIEWSGNYPDFKWRPSNVSEAKLSGLNINYTFNKKWTGFYKYLNPEDANGDKLKDRELVKAGFSYKSDEESSWHLNMIGKKYYSDNSAWPAVTKLQNNKWILNYSWTDGSTFISFNNIFDKNYIVNFGYPEAERTFVFGFEEKF